MYIEPNSDIYLLSDIPLDNDYTHSILFSSTSSQTAYFQSKIKHSLNKYTYIRENDGVAKVGIPIGQLYDCNYMMFRNTSFSSKWFYAFVTKVDYINNSTTRINFEIDVLQTWHFDYELLPCIVDRQHTTTDNIGDSLTPEPFSISDYQESNIRYCDGKTMSVTNIVPPYDVLFYSANDADNPVVAGYAGTVFCGLKLTPCKTSAEIISFITGLGEKASDLIVNITTIPSWVSEYATLKASPFAITTSTSYEYDTSQLWGSYKPKNKKLYQYPFCKISIKTPSGVTDIKPEYVTDNKLDFETKVNIAGNTTLYLTPKGYMSGLQPNYNYTCSLSGYSKCAYSYSAYKQWLAYNQGSLTASTISNLLTAPINPVSSITNLINTAGTLVDVTNMPNKVEGSLDGSGCCGAGLLMFILSFKHVTKEMAQVYDDFFTKYGYSIQKLQTPNRSARPEYTYIKTQKCEISGSLPNDIVSIITNIYNKGITWWKTPANVGNYSVNNQP